MSTLLSKAAASWLANHHGAATSAELAVLGLGRTARERLLSTGVLERPVRGVYVMTTQLPTLEHRCRVLCCQYPNGFVTGPTAQMLEDLRRKPVSSELHFSVRHGLHVETATGVRLRQTTKLADADIRQRTDGIAIASWNRLAFDLAADLRPLDHRSVVHQLLDKNLVDGDTLVAIGNRLCHPARRGTTTFLASLLEIGHGVHDSHPEVLLLNALVRRGVPVDAQVPFTGSDGVQRHVDIGVPEIRWGIEIDIHPEHRTVDGHRRDAERRRTMHASGWQIEPVAELDLEDIEALADQLVRLYRARAAAAA